MRIGQAATDAGVNVQTLRYYERRGLLPSPKRRASGYREYSADAVQVVRFIKRAQELGFSLVEVGELLEFRAHDGSTKRLQVRALAEAKVAAIDRKIRSLRGIKQSLTRLVATCSTSDGDACPCAILESLE